MKLVVAAASPMNVQHRRRSTNKQQQQPIDLNGSMTDLRSNNNHFDMDSLHSSYGSLNGSDPTLNASMSSLGQYHDADQFQEPEQAFFSPRAPQSPWNVKLRKAKATTSSPSRVKHVSHQRTGDWKDASASSLLEDFHTDSPNQSPLRKRFTKPPLPTTQPMLALPVYTSPVKTKNVSSLQPKADAVLPIQQKSIKATTKKSLRKTKKAPSVSTKTKHKNTTMSHAKTPTQHRTRFTPPPYSKHHETAAVRIAALARGRRGRLEAKVRQLERKLAMIEVEQLTDIMEIRTKCKHDKKELKKRARERFTKNLNRKGHQDTKLEENQETIDRIRQENAKVREQNIKMAKDIQALRVNNERLTTSQEATEACFSQLQYHDDTCEAENARLRAITAKYEKAVDDHQEHLDMHNTHIEAEEKIKDCYKKLLDKILVRLEESKGYKVLTSEVREMAEELDHLDVNDE